MDFGKPPEGCPYTDSDVRTCSCVQVSFCELLRIIETVEPALLSYRDVLQSGENREAELKRVEDHLRRFRALKVVVFSTPAAEQVK